MVFEFNFDSNWGVLGNAASLRILAIERQQIGTYLFIIYQIFCDNP